MSNQISLHANIHGHVQGVYFRAFILARATELGLTGYVRNVPSGLDVEVHAEGEKEKLEKLVEHLKIGPPESRVERVTVNWARATGIFSRFLVRN